MLLGTISLLASPWLTLLLAVVVTIALASAWRWNRWHIRFVRGRADHVFDIAWLLVVAGAVAGPIWFLPFALRGPCP